MKQEIHLWIEEYLFFPNFFQKIISFLLLPLTLIYLIIIFTKRFKTKKMDFDIPIISIGNIIVGGSGKTPITIELASKYENVCVILRGYGRSSKGLQIVSLNGDIKVDVTVSGDEAMLLAKSLKKATIIVSENRIEAILKAKELGSKIIFLDDGFSKYSISKFDILLKPQNEPTNNFCLPSGGYREPKSFYKKANIVLQEGKDFKRVITIKKDENIKELPTKTILLTAISKPKRLLEFLPKNIKMISFPDHHNFTKEEILHIQNEYKDYAILTTGKDMVKLKEFNLENLYLMDLCIKIDENVDFSSMNSYINSFK
ncbi:tetraacyldisaccharide 4'-kinase [Aliarcobacter butzleri]|uniref:tetraacyldisaccharide 4'-kinase n=1 Tax=Aliarcobacter butzleri TaxID=28197 RepID=UPI0021B69348|nr:tetraacyldisaccharide 4'-kinase [Aliarcobacter butzleri]MCT7574736.1 tetraacyldisaccharide 4'-kinase [Aliarcobacter butzleri]MDK2083789.1 tetraacyldisaccharide 4'-kinase [Aliarcobacter butzleri]